MAEETDIQKLLRLKRFEQPPEEYFDNFLEEFQRRQRTEFLRRSLWQIVCDRSGAFFDQLTIPQVAYGAASAAVLTVAGILSVGILSSDPTSPQFAADTTNSAVARVQPAAGTALVYSPESIGGDLDFSSGTVHPSLQASATGGQPRYVIDARPVSYEAPFSF
jgi:hypothetical protein